MKPNSLISLVCSLAINGFNTFHQPAAAGQVPPQHIAEALSPAETTAVNNDLVAIQVGDKYGYRKAKGRIAAIKPIFDKVDSLHNRPPAKVEVFSVSGVGSRESGVGSRLEATMN